MIELINEMVNRWKRIPLLYQIALSFIPILSIVQTFFTFYSAEKLSETSWFLIILNPVSFSAWKLPVFIFPFTILIKHFNTFERIRFQKIDEYKINLFCLIVTSSIANIFSVLPLATLVILNSSHIHLKIWILNLFGVFLSCWMFFLVIGLIELLLFEMFSKKFMTSLFLLTGCIGVSSLSIDSLSYICFFFLGYTSQINTTLFINKIFIFIGILLILLSIIYDFSIKKDFVKENL